MEIPKSISPRAARIDAGLKQKDAAKALKISKGTLANYESYKTVPTADVAKRMADLYGWPVDRIIFCKESVL